MRQSTKYVYYRVIQQNYGSGWQDVSTYDCNSKGICSERSEKLSPNGKRESLLTHDLREYRLHAQSYNSATRVIFRRELRNKF